MQCSTISWLMQIQPSAILTPCWLLTLPNNTASRPRREYICKNLKSEPDYCHRRLEDWMLGAGSAAGLLQRPRFLQNSTLSFVKQMSGISLLGDSERCVFPDVLRRLETRWQTVTRAAPDTIHWPPSEVSILPVLNSVELLIKLLLVTVKAGLQFECPSSRVGGFPRYIQSFTDQIQHKLFLLYPYYWPRLTWIIYKDPVRTAQ
jgi:hypothetical protein